MTSEKIAAFKIAAEALELAGGHKESVEWLNAEIQGLTDSDLFREIYERGRASYSGSAQAWDSMTPSTQRLMEAIIREARTPRVFESLDDIPETLELIDQDGMRVQHLHGRWQYETSDCEWFDAANTYRPFTEIIGRTRGD